MAASLYAEEAPSGQRYFEAVVTCFERQPGGGVVGLLCTERCAGLPAEARCARPRRLLLPTSLTLTQTTDRHAPQ